MLPIRNISYLSPMCCSFWEKFKNSPKSALGCSTPLKMQRYEHFPKCLVTGTVHKSSQHLITSVLVSRCRVFQYGTSIIGMQKIKNSKKNMRKLYHQYLQGFPGTFALRLNMKPSSLSCCRRFLSALASSALFCFLSFSAFSLLVSRLFLVLSLPELSMEVDVDGLLLLLVLPPSSLAVSPPSLSFWVALPLLKCSGTWWGYRKKIINIKFESGNIDPC